MSVIILPIVDFNNDVKAAAKKKAAAVEGGAKA